MAVNGFWRRLTRLDRIIVMLLFALCILLFIAVGMRPPGRSVRVTAEGATLFTAPLERDRTAELTGPLGTTRMEIRDGKVRIVSSPCPYKVCIGMGDISHAGEIIACVPNRLLVQILGDEAEGKGPGYDLLSR